MSEADDLLIAAGKKRYSLTVDGETFRVRAPSLAGIAEMLERYPGAQDDDGNTPDKLRMINFMCWRMVEERPEYAGRFADAEALNICADDMPTIMPQLEQVMSVLEQMEGEGGAPFLGRRQRRALARRRPSDGVDAGRANGVDAGADHAPAPGPSGPADTGDSGGEPASGAGA
jgi:hypothetical protein